MATSGRGSTIGILLGSATAIVAAAEGPAQAADAPLKKAPAPQFVKVCDIYGAGFFQMQGTVFCAAFRGQLQIDTNYEAGKDAVFVQQDSKKNGNSYSANVVTAGSQDTSGWQVQAKPVFDLRTETTLGTLRTVIQPRFQFNLGIFQGGPGAGFEANKTPDCYRCYAQWAGFTALRQGFRTGSTRIQATWPIGSPSPRTTDVGDMLGQVAGVCSARHLMGKRASDGGAAALPGDPRAFGQANTTGVSVAAGQCAVP